MGPLPPFAVAQGAQLLIRPVDKPINTTFICNVTNALGARQAELTVQVKGEELPGSGEQGPKEEVEAGFPLQCSLAPILLLSLLTKGPVGPVVLPC